MKKLFPFAVLLFIIACNKPCLPPPVPPVIEPSPHAKIRLEVASSNPPSRTVKVSPTTKTNGVGLLNFKLKATGGTVHFDEFPITLQSGGSSLSKLVNKLTLVIDGHSYDEDVPNSTAGGRTIVFNDMHITIDNDQTISCEVYADINSLQSGFNEGDWLMAFIPHDALLATPVIDINRDLLPDSSKIGAAFAEMVIFRTKGVTVKMSDATFEKTTSTDGSVTSVTYTIPVAVTSFGSTLYIGQSAQLSSFVSGTNAFAVTFRNRADSLVDDILSSGVVTITSVDAPTEGQGFRLDDGATKHFVIKATLITPHALNSNYCVQLKEIQVFANANLTNGAIVSNLLPENNFRTGYQFINN